MKNFTHINNSGEANMVDISDKKASKRVAIASGSVNVSKKTLELIKNDNVEKGDIFSTARIAGIIASKKTHELIPLCHNINIDFIKVDISVDSKMSSINVICESQTTQKTGVEMEALVACSVACLTIYDMIKSRDKKASITNIKLDFKSGGKSGIYKRR
ncbi:MAG: cyclic pyranopterin monophosphate synthase MoaC [Pseudomonadota bacterium]|nr:cyclic pyranopterin monophosphate synthase MoaC [Pseudomonadota bacterium]MEC7091042.1 cyclic pyranopterin monophosphate synthase MoaC [Pseudomonadota bacterium]MEC8315618.1 cyclic pyranopterin monophosphate synthase MoaC [Pseudomonadota bacterium]|tara:strand:+ start:645 stop:1121 length:477 start_codon:yes stop_codon:yes gene_type:complete